MDYFWMSKFGGFLCENLFFPIEGEPLMAFFVSQYLNMLQETTI